MLSPYIYPLENIPLPYNESHYTAYINTAVFFRFWAGWRFYNMVLILYYYVLLETTFRVDTLIVPLIVIPILGIK